MPLNLTLLDYALRILLACAAGALIGYNREGRNEAAGLRTTILVCLAACIAMLLGNAMLTMQNLGQQSILRMDVLRFPLGILSGIGFLGAGAILKKRDTVQGVTTAATLWFMTVIGLCFGAGQLALGGAGTAIAFAVVAGLRIADEKMHRRQQGQLNIAVERDRLAEAELRSLLEAAGLDIISWSVAWRDGGARYEASIELGWRGTHKDRAHAPDVVGRLAGTPGVLHAEWKPEALSD